jgi:hypothetical protein
MPLREGHEFLRSHPGHPSARMSLSPATERGFYLGPAGAAHSLTSACRVTRPRGLEFSPKFRSLGPSGPGGGGADTRFQEIALDMGHTVRDSLPTATPRRRTVGVMVRQETSRLSHSVSLKARPGGARVRARRTAM